MEAATDNFINVVYNAWLFFVRVGGASSTLMIPFDAPLLGWIGCIIKLLRSSYHSCTCSRGACFPLNPFALIRIQVDSVCLAIINSIRPDNHSFDFCFDTRLVDGFVLDFDVWGSATHYLEVLPAHGSNTFNLNCPGPLNASDRFLMDFRSRGFYKGDWSCWAS